METFEYVLTVSQTKSATYFTYTKLSLFNIWRK